MDALNRYNRNLWNWSFIYLYIGGLVRFVILVCVYYDVERVLSRILWLVGYFPYLVKSGKYKTNIIEDNRL